MNGSCAGGTGAFIDQMATLMNVSVDEMDKLYDGYEKIYPIASRCGVFAKSDIQPLLNQGARREDVAAGILRAVVNQTVAGLAQGREITGKLLYARRSPDVPSRAAPKLRRGSEHHGALPENSLYFVAYGAPWQTSGKSSRPQLSANGSLCAPKPAPTVTSRRCLPRNRTTRRSPRAIRKIPKVSKRLPSQTVPCTSASTPAPQPSRLCSATSRETSFTRPTSRTAATPCASSVHTFWTSITPTRIFRLWAAPSPATAKS